MEDHSAEHPPNVPDGLRVLARLIARAYQAGQYPELCLRQAEPLLEDSASFEKYDSVEEDDDL